MRANKFVPKSVIKKPQTLKTFPQKTNQNILSDKKDQHIFSLAFKESCFFKKKKQPKPQIIAIYFRILNPCLFVSSNRWYFYSMHFFVLSEKE